MRRVENKMIRVHMNDFHVIILKCKNFFSKFLGGLFCVKVGRYIFPSLLVRNFFLSMGDN